MEKHISENTRTGIAWSRCFPGIEFTHWSLLIPAAVILMQSIGLYGGGSRRDAVPLSVLSATF